MASTTAASSPTRLGITPSRLRPDITSSCSARSPCSLRRLPVRLGGTRRRGRPRSTRCCWSVLRARDSPPAPRPPAMTAAASCSARRCSQTRATTQHALLLVGSSGARLSAGAKAARDDCGGFLFGSAVLADADAGDSLRARGSPTPATTQRALLLVMPRQRFSTAARQDASLGLAQLAVVSARSRSPGGWRRLHAPPRHWRAACGSGAFTARALCSAAVGPEGGSGGSLAAPHAPATLFSAAAAQPWCPRRSSDRPACAGRRGFNVSCCWRAAAA